MSISSSLDIILKFRTVLRDLTKAGRLLQVKDPGKFTYFLPKLVDLASRMKSIALILDSMKPRCI